MVPSTDTERFTENVLKQNARFQSAPQMKLNPTQRYKYFTK